MKTKEELNALKEEVEALNKKLAELTDEELAQIVGGSAFLCPMPCGMTLKYGTHCNVRNENDPVKEGSDLLMDLFWLKIKDK